MKTFKSIQPYRLTRRDFTRTGALALAAVSVSRPCLAAAHPSHPTPRTTWSQIPGMAAFVV